MIALHKKCDSPRHILQRTNPSSQREEYGFRRHPLSFFRVSFCKMKKLLLFAATSTMPETGLICNYINIPVTYCQELFNKKLPARFFVPRVPLLFFYRSVGVEHGKWFKIHDVITL